MSTSPITQTNKFPSLSDKYQFIDTQSIMAEFKRLDFTPIKEIATKVKKREHEGFQKHFIEFTHPKLEEQKETLGLDSFPRLMLVNSHNGSTSLQIKLALFRLVCANGLIVERGSFGGVALRHAPAALGKLEGAILQLTSNALEIAPRIKELDSKIVTSLQARDFASEAIKLRLDTSAMAPEVLQYNIDSVLGARRVEDADSTAWKVFNRVQESIIKGKNRMILNGKVRNARSVTSPQSKLDFNRALWSLAEKTLF